MRAKYFKKIFSLIMIVSLFSQTALVFSPRTALAQLSAGGGGSVQTGFDVQGIAGTALVCSGVADKMAGLLNSLFGAIIPTTVPVNDPANDLRENCLKQITRTIINKILDKITLSTVDWINHGFEGDAPLWIEDSEQFFGDIARSEINGVTGWFTCSGAQTCVDYPFGRLVMESVLLNLQRQSQQNLQFSLNQVLAHGTYEEFRYDFSVGGWAGYNAFLEPQNNPFGNYLLVNEDLGRRIGGTRVTTAQNFTAQLNQSGGFLSPRVCDLTATGDPGDIYIDASDPMHVPQGGPVPAGVYSAAGYDPLLNTPMTETQAATVQEFTLRSQCTKWRVTTPGNVVGSRLTQGLDTSTNQLIAADDVAENIGLIFDALLNQLFVAGLKGLSSDNTDSVLLAQVNGQQPGAVGNNQAQPPVIDIIQGTGVVDQELLDVQTQYIANAQIALPLLDELIRKIRAVDYCVPGPNPRWLETGTTNFQQALASVPPAPLGGTPSNDEHYYALAAYSMTGVMLSETPAIYTYTQFQTFMNNVFNKYTARMTANYSPNLAPPTVRFFLPALFNDLEAYNSEYADLTEYLANITPLLTTIANIQSALDAIAAANGGVLDPANPQVQAQVSIFNSISSHLATEDQLDILIARIIVYQSQIPVINGHLDSCIAETVSSPYPYANSRMPYPAPYFPYPGLPGPNATFLPGVDLNDNDSPDINVEINGTNVFIPSNGLTDFEGVLQSVY